MKDEFDVSYDGSSLAIDRDTTPQPRKQTDWLLIAIIVMAGWWWMSNQTGPSPGPNPDDQTIIEDGDSSPINVDGCSMVFVFEKTSPTAEQSALLNDFAFFDGLKSQGMKSYATFDDEQPEAKPYIEYANGRGLASPLVAIVKDKAITKAGPFNDRQSLTELMK